MQETLEEFAKNADAEFGKKVSFNNIHISDENLEILNKELKLDLTREDFEAYGKHVWVIGTKCPKCDSDLLGLFGYFVWGLCHGEGRCCDCNTLFRYYHYLKPKIRPISLFELIGF